MATDEEFAQYEGLLHQSDIWPSVTKGQEEPILDMSPQHAIAAYRKLCRWAETVVWAEPGFALDPMRDYLLGQALITQALGHSCGQAVYHPFEQLEDDELVECLIAASEASTEAEAVYHYRMAKEVIAYLDDHEIVVFRSTPTTGGPT